MKIVCEACAAKYSISDDKVRGKVFKIRCKKCSHIIVVRGNADEGGSYDAEPAAPDAVAPAASAEAVWYVVVDGEQVGPMTEADVAGRIARGEIASDTFAWREGMADWIQVSAISEFAGSLASAPSGGGLEDGESPFAPQPTAVYPPGTAENMFGRDGDETPSPSSSSGGKRSEATEVFGAPTAVSQPPAGHDLFAPQRSHSQDLFGSAGKQEPFGGAASSPSSSHGSGGGGGFFNVPNAAPAAASPGGGLTAQRSENSVLFSLSNLEALAAPTPASPSAGYGGGFSPGRPGMSSSPAAAPTSEGSGLIDIRSMAAMTLGKQPQPEQGFTSRHPSAPELPTFSAAPLSPMAPMLMPHRASAGVPGYVWVMAGVMVLALGGLTYAYLKTSDPAVAPPTGLAAPAPVGSAPSSGVAQTPPPSPVPAETAPPAKEEALPPREETATAAPERERERSAARKNPSSGGGKKSNVAAAPARNQDEPAAAKPAPTPEPAAAPKKGSLDDLLAGAVGGSAPKKSSAPAATPAPAAEPAKKMGPLNKSDIVKGMMAVMPKTKACYDQYKVPGTANVNLKVGSSGRVEDASVTGKFAGTPTGDCVEKAVKTAKFPASDGLSFPYPIPLR